MIHESRYGNSHLENDHVNGSMYGCSHPSKRIITKPRYGRNHLIMRRITYDKSWSSCSQPSNRDMHVIITMSHHFRSWTFMIWVQDLALQHDPEKSTDPSVWIYMLTSNMLESHLITSHWCKLLTSAIETTNNENGRQGTISIIHGMWIHELKSVMKPAHK